MFIFKIIPQALIDCIETGEFIHVHNAIIVLKEVLPVFPVAAASGTAGHSLVTVFDCLVEREERGYLKILARVYHASLELRTGMIRLPFVLFARFTVSPFEGNWQPRVPRKACTLESRLCPPLSSLLRAGILPG